MKLISMKELLKLYTFLVINLSKISRTHTNLCHGAHSHTMTQDINLYNKNSVSAEFQKSILWMHQPVLQLLRKQEKTYVILESIALGTGLMKNQTWSRNKNILHGEPDWLKKPECKQKLRKRRRKLRKKRMLIDISKMNEYI